MKKLRIRLAVLLVLALGINLLFYEINTFRIISCNVAAIRSEEVRNLGIDVDFKTVCAAADDYHVPPAEFLTVRMIGCGYQLNKDNLRLIDRGDFVRTRNKILRFEPEKYQRLKALYASLLTDFKYFPIPKSTSKTKWVNYVDSWGYERTYGGERRHEGTDIMADVNKAGVYPVISVSDGVVSNMGWLELGGYRIGITSDSGVYYYYAHLDSYAEQIHIGDRIEAGTFIGFMGNTGYSKVEGTKGKFDVHLHFGIYYTVDGTEMAVNPYYVLKNLENNVLYYNYAL